MPKVFRRCFEKYIYVRHCGLNFQSEFSNLIFPTSFLLAMSNLLSFFQASPGHSVMCFFLFVFQFLKRQTIPLLLLFPLSNLTHAPWIDPPPERGKLMCCNRNSGPKSFWSTIEERWMQFLF